MPIRSQFVDEVEQWFGRPDDPIEAIARRAGDAAIVWEGDASTFEFSFVSQTAEAWLGFPTKRWTTEATFWADVVIEPADRDDAIAYCAFATTKRADHVFEYRAHTVKGATLWLRDYVRVVVGTRGVATTLRGIMVDITAEKRADNTFDQPSAVRIPSRDELAQLA